MTEMRDIRRAFKAAFPHTIPILAGFLFVGLSYGLYMNAEGFPFWYPFLMALLIFGGSLEFIAASMLLTPFAPVQMLIVAFMVQARHLFYGISMLKKYRGIGKKKWYMIFGLCDETFAINYSTEIPDGIDKGWFYFAVTILDHFYWVIGALIGGLLGAIIPFSTEGIEFVMTALFLVIFIDQWRKEKRHVSALVGILASVACLLVFGADSFLIPTMLCIVLLLTVFRKPLEKRWQKK
ncbi:MAG TPA: AzlC family ABC transporter permease [Methanocorpusculum sp.]|nr:AzlC family ABC transporter permease [Methanocorpusculum sp.]HJJ39672.1 AzlC family ABC transporter permease [Methanocorpusculum sp.]HJJ49281.1 AzlC family ABC transporter permease [Methanocorpusculum sp.]HJJ56675.1 AzlC family ABC transporter permease [Methanocorpusculum sp.]HJJ95740.1 AzlC family ABC transporter permease [Methanocorpusculum sp.]